MNYAQDGTIKSEGTCYLRKKSPRLCKIVGMCKKTHVIADIGADHGYTCAALLKRGLAGKVIASDISEKSIDKARRLFDSLGLQENAQCRIGDGLSVLKAGEAGGIILSGMGAPVMISILKKGIEVARLAEYLVLSPHTYPERLRRFLLSSGFRIESEEVVQESGKYYIIIQALAGCEEEYTRREFLLGRHGKPSPERHGYLLEKVSQYRQIVQKARGSARGLDALTWLCIYETALKELEEARET